jgi:hypothetical protein
VNLARAILVFIKELTVLVFEYSIRDFFEPQKQWWLVFVCGVGSFWWRECSRALADWSLSIITGREKNKDTPMWVWVEWSGW